MSALSWHVPLLSPHLQAKPGLSAHWVPLFFPTDVKTEAQRGSGTCLGHHHLGSGRENIRTHCRTPERKSCYGLNYVPQNPFVGVLTPRPSKCNLIGREGLPRGDQVKTRSRGRPKSKRTCFLLKGKKIWTLQGRHEAEAGRIQAKERPRTDSQQKKLILPQPDLGLPGC